MGWQQFRERANLYLFNNKKRTLTVFKVINILLTLLGLATIIWLYGYKLSPRDEQFAYTVIKLIFGFYVLHYLVKIVFDFNPRQFIRNTWFEGLIMFILLVEGITFTFFNELLLQNAFVKLGVEGFEEFSTIFIQAYFFIVVFVEFVRGSELLPRIRINPAVIFVLSFIFIIMTGTFLLMLPEMTVAGNLPLVDALFTATSATCVTGLLTLDVHTVFTFKGQFIILLCIQLGGLNIVAFGGFLALAAKFGVGIRHYQVIEGFVNKDNILSARGMLGKVILWTLSFEALGTLALYTLWDPGIEWQSRGERFFYSVFHSISAFNNAGISTFTDGLGHAAVQHNYLVHWVIMLLLFFGGLGILTIFELFDPRKLRERLRYNWKQISFASKIALYFSLWLVAGGAVLFFVLEYHGVLEGHSLFGQITTALFQSVTPRTGGFNTVNFSMLGMPTIMIVTALMYIGASSSSTGGGIKTSSFAIIWSDVRAAMTGRQSAVLFKRTINPVLKTTAYSIAIMYVVMNFVGAFALCVSEDALLALPGVGVEHLVFEQVSAFSTVGLSLGITSFLSITGKYILIVSMFIGRVGTFTIAFALAGRALPEKFKYPDGETLVG